MTTTPKKSGGVSLIELLIALAASGILMVGLARLWQSSATMYTVGINQLRNVQNATDAMDIVDGDMRCLAAELDTPPAFRFYGEDNIVNGNDRISYYVTTYSATEDDAAATRSSEIQYRVLWLDPTGSLHYDHRNSNATSWKLPVTSVTTTSQTLLDNVTGFQAEYRDTPGNWVKSWDSDIKKCLPRQIRISVTVDAGGSLSDMTKVTLTSLTGARQWDTNE